MTSINKTIIAFDTKLIACCKLLVETNPDDCMTHLKSNDYRLLQIGQRTIREWMIRNQSLLTIGGNGKLSMATRHQPNFFAIMCAVICDRTACKSWEDVTADLLRYNDNKRALVFCDFSGGVPPAVECACSHPVSPENSFILQGNTHNIILGCDCGVKSSVIDKPDFKQLRKPDIYEAIIRERLDKVANKAKLNRIAAREIKRLEKEAVLKITMNPCSMCKKFIIPKTAPAYWKKCKPCHFRNV